MAKKSKKKAFKKHVAFGGRMVMVGFGSIGQGVLKRNLDGIGAQKPGVLMSLSDARDDFFARQAVSDKDGATVVPSNAKSPMGDGAHFHLHKFSDQRLRRGL